MLGKLPSCSRLQWTLKIIKTVPKSKIVHEVLYKPSSNLDLLMSPIMLHTSQNQLQKKKKNEALSNKFLYYSSIL